MFLIFTNDGFFKYEDEPSTKTYNLILLILRISFIKALKEGGPKNH